MRERFVLVLEADGGGEPPTIIRLRQALKRLLRSYRLRCVRIEPETGHVAAVNRAGERSGKRKTAPDAR